MFRRSTTRTTVLLFTLVCLVSAQYDNLQNSAQYSQPMNFQPIPIVLQLPNREQHRNSANFRYSTAGNDNEVSQLIDREQHHNTGNFRYSVNGNGNENDHLMIDVNNFKSPPLRRNDVSVELSPNKMRFLDEKPRNIQRDRYDTYGTRHSGRTSKGSWQTRNSPKRPSGRQYRKETPSGHRGIFRDEVAEVKRSPRIVKYIADQNGFAVREDLIHPLQNSLSRARQRQARILTVAGSSPPMSHVVTSAIQVDNGQSEGGKYVPQVVDLKVGVGA